MTLILHRQAYEEKNYIPFERTRVRALDGEKSPATYSNIVIMCVHMWKKRQGKNKLTL